MWARVWQWCTSVCNTENILFQAVFTHVPMKKLRTKPACFNLLLPSLSLITFLLLCPCAQAQTDSTGFYHKLNKKADRHKLTRWIFDAVFVDPDNIPVEEDSVIIAHSIRSLKVENPYLKYQGKPIRSLRIEVLDPFGNSVHDTFKRPTEGIQRIGNRLHITTRERVIRNLLLFREGDRVDAIRLSESERLLRTAPYVNDARVFVSGKQHIIKGKKKNIVLTDSVDVVVRVLDKWSVEPQSNFDLLNPNLLLTESNLGGWGHSLSEGVYYNGTTGALGNTGSYGIYNIGRSYIRSSFFYYTDPLLSTAGIAFDRPFFSPLAKWGGGVLFTKNYSDYHYIDSLQPELNRSFPIEASRFDAWVGKNFRVGNRNKLKDKVANVFAGVRYYEDRFQQWPAPGFDPFATFVNQHVYLANVGFSKTKYYKERYISRFGANEDIPLGFSVQVIGGYAQIGNRPDLYYNGITFTNGHLFRKFYLQTTLMYGSLNNKNSLYRGVASVECFTFSNLMQFGRWYFRQFARLKYVEGINRKADEFVTLMPSEMHGFSSPELLGKSKAFINLQTIIYLPYNLVGFKFAPVLTFAFGQVGSSFSDIFGTRLYQAYSLGVLVRNENLLFNTFEVSLSIYPYVPGEGYDRLGASFSSGRNTNFGNFNVGRPDMLPYY